MVTCTESTEIPSAEDQHDSVIDQLECGSSLAELEHNLEDRPETNSNVQIDSIAFLRERLANDVLTTSSSIESFTSPFEVPSSLKASTSSTDKYLKVPLVYCDQTASNRPLKSVEDYIRNVCLPLYGNTHTNTSITGSQSTAFCAEARQIVAEGTNAKITGKASLDVVLFAGNGATSAVELLIDCMGLKHACANNSDQRPVVFVGPYEHHSNLLPWRESGCQIVMVPECQTSFTVNIQALEKLLTSHEYQGRLRMGTFTAASNVTGKVTDVDAIAAVLHKHGALAFFDYATGAPYLNVNMNPAPSQHYPSASLVSKDAIFISPHKMLGGVGTPGVLVVKKHLVHQVNPPSKSGGGTVFYVTSTHHRFLSNRIERYEGGTSNVPGILRTGLAFLLKRKTERHYAQLQKPHALPPTLEEMEYATYRQVAKTLLERIPNLVLLGDALSHADHLPIFSFLIRCGKRFLHYNYVCALLNDIFGIQSRGGCQCSGPYSQRLLGLTFVSDDDGTDQPNERNAEVEYALVHLKGRAELLRPGFTRISLPFKGLRDVEVAYVLDALEWVAKFGWIIMPQYRCNHRTGEWRHSHRQGKPLGKSERKWLSHYDIFPPAGNASELDTLSPWNDKKASVASILQQARFNADIILEEARNDQRSIAQALKMNEVGDGSIGEEDDILLEQLRWFVYPKECATWLTRGTDMIPPETASPDVLGAIQPRAVSLANLASSLVAAPTNSIAVKQSCPISQRLTTIIDAPSRKRKNDARLASSVDTNQTDMDIPRQTVDELTPLVFAFREGEHTGESPISEIESGFDDGELSEHCEVYHMDSDSWLPIAEFLRNLKKGHLEESVPVFSASVSMEKANAAPAIFQQGLQLNMSEKSQKKKPARDSSQWGKNVHVHNKMEISVDDQVDETVLVVPPVMSVSEQLPSSLKSKKGKGLKPPPKLMRLITQAMVQWNMVEEGDRLLLGLSGGKDSISLLHCLLEFQRKLPIKFEIEVCTIDPMTPSFDPSPLIPYVESLGLKYHYIRDDIVDRANKSGRDGSTVSSLCAFCARMKRGNLYTCARTNNCNKLVLAQHLDDCAESFLMSVMHNGFLRTMKANYKINAGDISVIRPMVYCRESLMTEFVKAANLPVINENCPACFEEPKERARVKKLLTREETLFPNFYDNIRRSLIPLMHEDSTAILRCYTEEAVSRSRKENRPKIKLEDGVLKQSNRSKGSLDDEEKKDEMFVADATRMTADTSTTPMDIHDDAMETQTKRMTLLLTDASENDLIQELARRRADKFRMSGSMKRLVDNNSHITGIKDHDDTGLPEDPTGQMCSLNGDGYGSIPCRELME